MDPITIATRRFLRDLDRFWKRHPERIARMVARSADRGHVIKALRLAEHDPSNRRPLFIIDAPFDTTVAYFDVLSDHVRTDYELVSKGASEEGVTFEPLPPPAASTDLSPEDQAAIMLSGVADRIARHLDGALVGLIPRSISDPGAWRKSMDRLSRAPRSPALRIAVLDPDQGPLSETLGHEGARFSFDIDELFDFVEQQANRASAQSVASRTGPSREQHAAVERSLGHKLPDPQDAAAIQALFIAGARAAAKNDFKAASQAYGRICDLCHGRGLSVEEAVATFALGGSYLAAGARPMAQATYGRAALLAAEENLWNLACQAKLGEAGVGWIERDFARAARAYAEAANLAARGALPPLAIEALRMEGLCHQHRGAETEAVQAWRKAVEIGTSATAPVRAASSFPEVVTLLADLLEERGLLPQAEHMRSLLEAPAGRARSLGPERP